MITIHVDKIYFEHNEITDQKQITKIIMSHLSHLGDIKIMEKRCKIDFFTSSNGQVWINKEQLLKLIDSDNMKGPLVRRKDAWIRKLKKEIKKCQSQ